MFDYIKNAFPNENDIYNSKNCYNSINDNFFQVNQK